MYASSTVSWHQTLFRHFGAETKIKDDIVGKIIATEHAKKTNKKNNKQKPTKKQPSS